MPEENQTLYKYIYVFLFIIIIHFFPHLLEIAFHSFPAGPMAFCLGCYAVEVMCFDELYAKVLLTVKTSTASALSCFKGQE